MCLSVSWQPFNAVKIAQGVISHPPAGNNELFVLSEALDVSPLQVPALTVAAIHFTGSASVC